MCSNDYSFIYTETDNFGTCLSLIHTGIVFWREEPPHCRSVRRCGDKKGRRIYKTRHEFVQQTANSMV